MHPLKNSLVLYGPHNEELYAAVWSAEVAPRYFDDLESKITEPPSTPSELVFQTVAIRSNKDWLQWAVQNVPPDDRRHGWKKRYAQKLASAMRKDAQTNSHIRPLPWESIRSRLTEIGWPETHDKNTTINKTK